MHRATTLLLIIIVGITSFLCFLPFIGHLMATNFPTEEATEAINAGAIVIDVRTPEEFAGGHLDGALNIPYDEIAQRISEITEERDRMIVLYCRSGRRASVAEEILRSNGFTNVLNAGAYSELKKNK